MWSPLSGLAAVHLEQAPHPPNHDCENVRQADVSSLRGGAAQGAHLYRVQGQRAPQAAARLAHTRDGRFAGRRGATSAQASGASQRRAGRDGRRRRGCHGRTNVVSDEESAQLLAHATPLIRRVHAARPRINAATVALIDDRGRALHSVVPNCDETPTIFRYGQSNGSDAAEIRLALVSCP